MRVSRSSWHYKVYRYWMNTVEDGPKLPFYGHRFEVKPTTLCRYFWAIVGLSVILPLIGLIVVAALIIAALPIAAGLGIRWLYLRNRVWRSRRRFAKYGTFEKATKVKEPNLVVQFAKAKKDKLCPIIELV